MKRVCVRAGRGETVIAPCVYVLLMEDLLAVLLDIEERAWKAADTRDVEFYREYLAPEALVVSPWGILDREGLLRDLVENPNEFPEYAIMDPRVVPLGEESAVLAYTVSFGGQTLYVATVYARDNGRWRAAFHQRTPALEGAGTEGK
jgi:hypothetical protein